MTKTEVITDIMYSLQFNDSADFEADGISYSINKGTEDTWSISSPIDGKLIKPQTTYENKTELRTALKQFDDIIQM